jgi:hypothetical protein
MIYPYEKPLDGFWIVLTEITVPKNADTLFSVQK